MVRMKLAMLVGAALWGSAVLASDGEGPRPHLPPHPCAALYRGQPGPAVAGPPGSFSSRPATPCPAPSASRIPSIYSRDYTPHAPAWPRPEPAPPPRDRPSEDPSASPAATASAPYFQTYHVALPENGLRQASAAAHSISFWNLSRQPITLRVLHQAYVLERGKSLVLELPHQFTWQIDGRAPETTNLPEDRMAMEIVIRK